MCRMVTVLKSHRHSENDAFAAVIAIRNKDIKKGPNEVNKEGRGPQPCIWQLKTAALTKQCAPEESH